NNLKNIKINSYEIPSYFADELGSIQIQLTNEHHKYLTRFIHIEINTSEFEIEKEIEIIKNRDNITVTCKILKSSRGLFPYPRIKIYSTFPFGLFYCWQIHDWQMSYFVYPERVGDIKVPQAFEEIEKELKLPLWLKKDNQNDEFFMHKEYNESDNFKRIDWKVFARKNKFYTKIFSSAEPKIIYVDLNSELDHLNGIPMEIKLKQITKWLFDAHKINTPCLIKTYNGKFSLLNGKNDYELIFQTLALHSIKGGVSIDN
ncbi:MAG: DUF58 domain-containing protein, partial [Bdellovibrionaceae bacterium]|nr:DUF58 domain-containing protein [Pseudobdellovibrionaceae bacterium]